MNIAKMARTAFLVALFLGTALAGSGYADAGFETASAASSSDAYKNPTVISNVQMDGTPLSAEPQQKSLEIFNDRYVPDSIRKKYNLDDSWFEKNVPPAPAPAKPDAPTSLTPKVLKVPPVLPDQLPAPTINAKQAAAVEVKSAVETWRGRKGENIRDVLQRWASRGGTDLMWASPDAPVLQKEFTYVGKFQDAVNALIKAEGGDKIHSQYRSEGLNPVMMAPASTVTTNTPPAVKGAPPVVEAKPQPLLANPLAKIFQPQEEKKDVKPETRWFALSGAPLAEVMKVWADDAGVQLIWQSERNFAVKESISQIGHFEDAVFKALNQYSAEDVRPVGEMYRDPQSGRQILLVRTEVN